MFLTILTIAALNVLKMFLNIIVCIGCAVVISIRTNQPEAQIRCINYSRYLGRQEYNNKVKEI